MILLGLAVFLSSVVIDYAHAQYAYARDAGRRFAMANWGVLQWGAASVGFVAAVKVSIWLLPLEGLGLWVGSFVAGKPGRRG